MMFLIVRTIGERHYLSAYQSRSTAQERLATFQNDGHSAFMISRKTFEYCRPDTGGNGLETWHPDFRALRVDTGSQTVAWDEEDIRLQIEERKKQLVLTAKERMDARCVDDESATQSHASHLFNLITACQTLKSIEDMKQALPALITQIYGEPSL